MQNLTSFWNSWKIIALRRCIAVVLFCLNVVALAKLLHSLGIFMKDDAAQSLAIHGAVVHIPPTARYLSCTKCSPCLNMTESARYLNPMKAVRTYVFVDVWQSLRLLKMFLVLSGIVLLFTILGDVESYLYQGSQQKQRENEVAKATERKESPLTPLLTCCLLWLQIWILVGGVALYFDQWYHWDMNLKYWNRCSSDYAISYYNNTAYYGSYQIQYNPRVATCKELQLFEDHVCIDTTDPSDYYGGDLDVVVLNSLAKIVPMVRQLTALNTIPSFLAFLESFAMLFLSCRCCSSKSCFI